MTGTAPATLAPSPAVLGAAPGPLGPERLRALDAWWRAANYLSVGQVFLLDNPLLREPLAPEHVKPRLLGHWGTTPGLTLLHAHATRCVVERDLDALYVMGPGHGGPGPNAAAWLEGTWSEVHSAITQDEAGMRALFRQFSFPGGVPSHVSPETPGSLHEGGELGYSLLHAVGACFDAPGTVVFCVIGDGEAETGPLAASWQCARFLDPRADGAVVPVLALNGWKIANPALLARLPAEELVMLLRGNGWEPVEVTGDDPAQVHQAMAAALDSCLEEVERARRTGQVRRRPMVVLRTPKGWTGPVRVDGLPVEGTWRAHQVPLRSPRTDPGHLAALEAWLRSYRPQELFDADGAPVAELRALSPRGDRRMSANPRSNGGSVLVDLALPDLRRYGVEVPAPGRTRSSPTRVLGSWLRDVVDANRDRFLLFGPDEVASNRLQDVLEVTGRRWTGPVQEGDDRLAPDGRVVEVLSEHLCQGMLEGYLLTGRHGLYTSYEAFVHNNDSMFNQHAKWLQACNRIPWRRPLASLNYLLSSHVWRQDHNGFTHQDPGFLDVVLNKKPEVVRVYLPPDANTLLSTYDHCLRSRQYVNVVVAGKQPSLDYLTPEQAALHCARGIGTWDWASSDGDGELPDVVLACAGDVPTLEVLAAAALLREALPDLRVRVVNVVDLMRLLPAADHPHGLPDAEFDALFTVDRPVVLAFHGYPWLVHRLTYKRHVHDNLHVRGYKEEGTTTTPFDMVMLNDLDRFHLVMDVVDRVPGLGPRAAHLRQRMVDARLRARAHTREHGVDLPEVADWTWPG